MSDIINQAIPSIPDWPVPGVIYRDITGLLTNPKAFKLSVDLIADFMLQSGVEYIVAPDARGFIWSAAVAYKLGLPIHMVRKPGKLPPPVITQDYEYEYASGSLQMKANVDIGSKTKIGIVDDVNATAGTALAIAQLLSRLGAETKNISYACVVDLPFLGGRDRITDVGMKFFRTTEYNG